MQRCCGSNCDAYFVVMRQFRKNQWSKGDQWNNSGELIGNCFAL